MAVSRVSNSSAVTPGNGLYLIKPASVVVGSGSASVNEQGGVVFTNANTVSINGCFTSSYKSYKIVFSTKHDSTATWVWMRLRKNSSDAATTSYWGAGTETNTSNTTVIRQADTSSALGFRMYICGAFLKGIGEATILNPSTVDVPSVVCVGQGYSGGVNYATTMSGFYDSPGTGVNTFDGFTFYPNTGSFSSGTVQVYGYNSGGI